MPNDGRQAMNRPRSQVRARITAALAALLPAILVGTLGTRRACCTASAQKPQAPQQQESQPAKPSKKPKPNSPKRISKTELDAIRDMLFDKALPLESREQSLRSFLSAAKQRGLPLPERRKLLVQLATFELALRRGRDAIRHFKEAEDSCRAEDRDIRARCRLGRAQGQELLGDSSEALRFYGEVRRRFAGTRFARVAQAALERLRSKQRIKIGTKLLLPAGTMSYSGRRVRAATGREASLLLFLPGKAPAISKLFPGSLAGLQTTTLPLRILVSAPREDARSWHKNLRKTKLAKRSVVLKHRIDRLLGVASLPSWLLLDREGKVFELNPSLRRLEQIFKRH